MGLQQNAFARDGALTAVPGQGRRNTKAWRPGVRASLLPADVPAAVRPLPPAPTPVRRPDAPAAGAKAAPGQ